MMLSEKKGADRAEGKKTAASHDAAAEETSEASRLGVYVFAVAMFCIGFAVVFGLTLPWVSAVTAVAAVLVGFALASTIRIATQWERIAVLRLGKFNRIAGPGLYVVIPFVEYAAVCVDQRIRVVPFTAEAALTLDLVPVDIDAAIYWVVWDAKKACLEVEDYPRAVLWAAQAAMRDAIGKLNLADLSPRRKQIDNDLEKILGEKCEEWGVSVLSVEIRDIAVPQELQDALSREAQAQSERNARLLLAEVEKDISEMLVDAASVYDQNPSALKIRAMNLAYEGARQGKGVLLAPSGLADGFNVSLKEE